AWRSPCSMAEMMRVTSLIALSHHEIPPANSRGDDNPTPGDVGRHGIDRAYVDRPGFLQPSSTDGWCGRFRSLSSMRGNRAKPLNDQKQSSVISVSPRSLSSA